MMRILHTADWHLGDRLGRIDRTDDLRRGVERIARYCAEERVDVLLVAGDLFSEVSRPDSLRESIEHLRETFDRFVKQGGTVVAVTGNHDNETFCQTLRAVMHLASPAATCPGELCPGGRFHLATDPTFLRLAGPDGCPVQFVLMPYPTPAHYLCHEPAQHYATREEKNRHLREAYARKLAEFRAHPAFGASLPTVLAAHVHVQGAHLPSLFRISEEDSIVFAEADVPTDFAYVALGHIHKPQCLMGQAHVRYSGSVDRLDLGERLDQKEVTVFDLGPVGLIGAPRSLPLEATPIYAVELHTPLRQGLEIQRQLHPDAQRDLVHVTFTYTAGVDSLEDTLKKLEELFPRWYYRHWTEANALDQTLVPGGPRALRSFEDTVRDYLKGELTNHSETQRDAVLARAESLMQEVQT